MSVSVSRDLTVMVDDAAIRKLTDRREELRKSIQRGEPKVLGVSQVMVGVAVISYSFPLLIPEFTEIVTFGVPWWSGTVFIVTGAIAIATDKRADMKFLCVCMVSTAIGLAVSILALIFYFIDLHNHPDMTPSEDCDPDMHSCSNEHHHIAFSRGVKSALLLFTVAQAVISCVLGYGLYKERRWFTNYAAMEQLVPPSPTGAEPVELN